MRVSVGARVYICVYVHARTWSLADVEMKSNAFFQSKAIIPTFHEIHSAIRLLLLNFD